MTSESPDLLLERMVQGDAAAAEEVLAGYEPYLRLVVRRHLSDQLRAKFDSADVVQSVWVHALHALRQGSWRLVNRQGLRALLATVARRRLVSRYRHHRPALDREQPAWEDLQLLPAHHQPRPSELAQANELWERMLALCPQANHELLHLRRQGLGLEEIAQRVGMHEGSVRRILRRLARQLALRQEPLDAAAEGGGADQQT
jgi:RNA polymerase sigma-70 factor (ECF subfamily)